MVAPIHRRALAAALGASAGAALLTVAPAAASASPLSASSCATSASLSEPFAPWGDTNLYRVMPGGSFSDGAPGWTLGGGTSIVATDDPFDLAGGDSPASLSLPAGGSAQSPFTCVDSSQPTVRFVDAGSATTALEVQVVYQLPGGSTISAPAAVLTPGASWDATPIIQDGATLAGLLSGGTAQMSVRLTAIGGPAQVDDVFVDPKMHG